MSKQLQREQMLLEMLYEKNELIKQLWEKIALLEKELNDLKENKNGGD